MFANFHFGPGVPFELTFRLFRSVSFLLTMKVLIIACLIVLAVAESEDGTSTTTTTSEATPAKSAEKPQAFQHQSSLKDNTNQHIDTQPESASSEEYRQLTADEVKQLLLKVILNPF